MEKNKSVVKQYNNAKLWQIGSLSLNNCAKLYIADLSDACICTLYLRTFGLAAFHCDLTNGTRIFDAVTGPAGGIFADSPTNLASLDLTCLWAHQYLDLSDISFNTSVQVGNFRKAI